MKPIEFPHSIVTYNDPVITIVFKEGATLDVPEIRELILASEKLSDKKPYLLFSDSRVFLTITPEARRVSALKIEAPYLIANAALINNLPLVLTANFFAKFNQPHFKFKMFTSEKKAMKWLLEFAPERKK